MATRTVKVYGHAIGNPDSPVTLVATVDGTEVFNGTVTTVASVTADEARQPGSVLFTFTQDHTFTGNKAVSIAVSGGTLMLTNTTANWVSTAYPEPLVSPYINVDESSPGYSETGFGPHSNDDPKTNVKVNGADVSISRDPSSTGEYYYTVGTGNTISFDLFFFPGMTVAP